MHENEGISISPCPDIELKWDRQPIDYHITLPKRGVNEETGLILIADGFGGRANSHYQAVETRPYLAERYNCIVAGVNYFGIERAESYQITQAFYENVNRIYGLGVQVEFMKNIQDIQSFVVEVANRLLEKGVINVDLRCQAVIVTGRGEYQSWGLLPAIDCLTVVGDILKNYKINRKRLIAYGHNYGGYIVEMMGKLAPKTFSVIVDKSGYVKTELAHVVTGELLSPDYVYKLPIKDFPLSFEMAAMANNPWALEDDESPNYFSDGHRKMRNLMAEDHRLSSDTRYYLFHGENDGFVDVKQKERYAAMLKKYNEVDFYQVKENDCSGGEFTRADSTLGINHADLFDIVAKKEKNGFAKSDEITDFALGSRYKFACIDRDYHIQFHEDFSLDVSMKKKKTKQKSIQE